MKDYYWGDYILSEEVIALDKFNFKGELKMGASSVTGVGAGVAKPLKGPGNGRNQYQPLISPNIVAAGFVTAGAGDDITVPLSGMTAAAAGLAVFVSGQVTASASLCKSKADVGGVLSSFVITASGAGLIAWMVVKP